MSNLKTKGIFTMLFTVTIFLALTLGNIFAAEKVYSDVSLSASDSEGEELEEGVEYTLDAGDKIYITASCEDELALYWSQNVAFMNQQGYKTNNEGMAILGYGFDNEGIENYRNSSDPTRLVITIPNFEAGTKHSLKISAAAANDGFVKEDKMYISKANITIDFVMYEEIIEEPEPENAKVIMKIEHEDGTELKGGKAYTNIEPGDKIYISAYCDSENAVRWSQNVDFMNQYGYKINDEGMAFIEYYYSDIVDGKVEENTEIEHTKDPTNAIITIPNFEPGSKHVLSIKGVGVIDNYKGSIARTGWINIYFTLPQEEILEPKISINISKINDTTLKATATVENGEFSKFIYHWDNDENEEEETNPLYITIPDFPAGTKHILTVSAVTTNGKIDAKTFIVEIPEEECEEPEVDKPEKENKPEVDKPEKEDKPDKENDEIEINLRDFIELLRKFAKLLSLISK